MRGGWFPENRRESKDKDMTRRARLHDEFVM